MGRSELSRFLFENIGGLSFDEESEVEREITSIMKRLDLDHDNGLDSKDVFGYWKSVESLLTVEEVVEWVVYAVQLPEEIGRIFWDNHVTAYDFAELVDNDGEALLRELNIEKKSFRRKIIRHIKARLLGVGSTPTAVSNIVVQVESCSAVSLSWAKSTARGFPVHSYRIQRRTVGGSNRNMTAATAYHGETGTCASDTTKRQSPDGEHDGTAQKEDNALFDDSISSDSSLSVIDSCPSPSNDNASPTSTAFPPQRILSEWQTVHNGADTSFIDGGLERGRQYTYRIQAWNAAGRSEWKEVKIDRMWKRLRCDVHHPPSLPRNGQYYEYHGSISWTSFVWGQVYTFFKLFTGMIVLIATYASTYLKFKLASLPSTASTTIDTRFPRFWKLIHHASKLLIGKSILPGSILGVHDGEDEMSDDYNYDESVRAVGLDGHPSQNRSTITNSTKSRDGRSSPVDNDATDADSNKDKPIETNKVTHPPRRSGRSTTQKRRSLLPRSFSANNLASPSASLDTIEEEKGRQKRSNSDDYHALDTPNSTRSETYCRPVSDNIPSFSLQSNRTDSKSNLGYKSPTIRSYDRRKNGRGEIIDSADVCVVCSKKFKIMKRYKHHCSRCFETFCHKHGKTNHSNLVPCKVPGKCLCNNCLEQ